MYSSLLVPQIGWIHLSLVSIVPWACGFGGGMLLSNYLVQSRDLRTLMSVLYVFATLAVTSWVGRMLPHPFP